MKCNNCGFDNLPFEMTCINCGSPLKGNSNPEDQKSKHIFALSVTGIIFLLILVFLGLFNNSKTAKLFVAESVKPLEELSQTQISSNDTNTPYPASTEQARSLDFNESPQPKKPLEKITLDNIDKLRELRRIGEYKIFDESISPDSSKIVLATTEGIVVLSFPDLIEMKSFRFNCDDCKIFP